MRVDTITEDQWPSYLEEVLSTHQRAEYANEINQWHTFLETEVLASWERRSGPEPGQGWPDWLWRNPSYHHIVEPLVNTGRLYNSFIRGGAGNVDSFNARTGKYGSSVPYAGTHQFGDSGVPVNDLLVRRDSHAKYKWSTIDIPARPMLGVRDDMVDVFMDSISDSLVEQMKG